MQFFERLKWEPKSKNQTERKDISKEEEKVGVGTETIQTIPISKTMNSKINILSDSTSGFFPPTFGVGQKRMAIILLDYHYLIKHYHPLKVNRNAKSTSLPFKQKNGQKNIKPRGNLQNNV